MKKIELLAPAGNKESAIAAIQNGADALYLSGELFGARAFAANFSMDEIREMVQYAHAYGCKIYITVNTLIYQHEFHNVMHYIDDLYHAQVDACIVQDLGLLYAIRKTYPDFEVHASTQMHVYNREALAFLHSQGVSRAVLARETSYKQMLSYRDIDIEKEVFVHGALCISFSGQCLFSALHMHRSGNRGMCAQNCRMLYRLYENGVMIHDYAYLLSPKDNFLLEDIDQLKNAEVHSLKIEGRMKSPQYVAYTTMLYRQAIDQAHFKIRDDQLEQLKVLFNRHYTKAHFYEKNDKQMMNHERPNHVGIPLGKVVYIRNNRIGISLVADIKQHDGIRFLNENSDGFTLNRIYVQDLLVNGANKGDVIEIDKGKLSVKVGCEVVKTKDVQLEATISQSYQHLKRKVDVYAKVKLRIGKPLEITVSDGIHEVQKVSDCSIDKAQKRPVEAADIQKRIDKANDTIFAFKQIEIEKDDNIFLPLQQINALRRQALDALYDLRVQDFTRKHVQFVSAPIKDTFESFTLELTVLSEEQLLACKDVKASLFTSNYELYKTYKDQIPVMYRQSNVVSTQCDEAKMVGDIGGLNQGKIIDESLNVSNSETVAYLQSMQNQHIYVSRELTHEAIFDLVQDFQKTYHFLPNIGVVLYGKAKVMHIKTNIIKAAISRTNVNAQYYLEDLHKHRYYLQEDKDGYISIYQDMPKDEIANIDQYKQMGIEHFRLDFTDESAKEVKAILAKIPNY